MPVWLWISLASLSCPRNRSLHPQLLAPSSLVLLQQQLLGPNTQTTNNLLLEHLDLDRDESSHDPDHNESSSCRVPFFKYRCVNKSRITSKHRLQEGILNKFQASMPTANANQNVGTYSMRIPLTIRVHPRNAPRAKLHRCGASGFLQSMKQLPCEAGISYRPQACRWIRTSRIGYSSLISTPPWLNLISVGWQLWEVHLKKGDHPWISPSCYHHTSSDKDTWMIFE